MKIGKEPIYDLYIEPQLLLKKKLPLVLKDRNGKDIVFDETMLIKYQNKAKTIIATKRANELSNVRVRKISRFEKMTNEHIQLNYDITKQISDNHDIIFCEGILKAEFGEEYFYKKIYPNIMNGVNKMFSNDSNINNELKKIKDSDTFKRIIEEKRYNIDIGELFKAYVRLVWLNRCKNSFRDVVEKIDSTSNIADMDKINLNLPEKIL